MTPELTAAQVAKAREQLEERRRAAARIKLRDLAGLRGKVVPVPSTAIR